MRPGIAAFAGLILFVTGCTSASTSTTAPSATKCEVSATPSARSFPHTGGAGSIAVTGARDCSWTMSSDASWLVLERSSGQGEASLPFRVAANDTPNARRGTLAIESTRLELAQEGAPCTFHLDNTRVEVDAGGAVVRIEVTAMADCAWSARALESWISVTSGASASGTGMVGLWIAPNSGPARQGSVTIADQTIIVTQRAVGSPSPSPVPAPNPVPSPPPSPAPPTPAPPPSPAPPSNPTPPSSPAPQDPIQVDGRVSSLRGVCPNLTFEIRGMTIAADGSTEYRGGNCKHVEEGLRVLVVGHRQSDGRVHAERIDLKPKD